MSRIAGFNGREVRRVAEGVGWTLSRTQGDHMVMVRPGARVNLSIPAHDSVKPGTLRRLIRDMGLTVDEFLERARK